MSGWIMGIAMGWLGFVIEYFAGMAKKKNKPQQLLRSACCSSEQSLYKPPRELRSNCVWHLDEYIIGGLFKEGHLFSI